MDRVRRGEGVVAVHLRSGQELAAGGALQRGGDMRRAIRLSGDFHLHIADRAGQQTMGRILRETMRSGAPA